jgi:short chain dehydrogenase
MSGSVAVVTGASQGIGRATALRLARDLSAIVLVARDEQELQNTAGDVRSVGAEALVCGLDLREPRSADLVVGPCDDRTPPILPRKVGARARHHRRRSHQEVSRGSWNQPIWKAGGDRRSFCLPGITEREVDERSGGTNRGCRADTTTASTASLPIHTFVTPGQYSPRVIGLQVVEAPTEASASGWPSRPSNI